MIPLTLLPLEIIAPKIEYGLLAPVLVVFAGACLGVLAEAVAPREIRRAVQLVITFVSLAAALATTAPVPGPSPHRVVSISYTRDG